MIRVILSIVMFGGCLLMYWGGYHRGQRDAKVITVKEWPMNATFQNDGIHCSTVTWWYDSAKNPHMLTDSGPCPKESK